ncbi:MAG: TonB-dependent siderophore receptor [Mangrovicoccus sp.]|nr:TonB-dependent siderophore receptor [Mangrovicoccus sp.]
MSIPPCSWPARNRRGLSLYGILALGCAAIPAVAQESGAYYPLEAIVVEGDPAVITEGSQSYAWDRVTVGGKQPQQNRDIPQTVTVLTREALDDAAVTSIEEAARLLPGVSVATGDGFVGSLYTRGQEVFQYYVDGAPRPFLSLYGTAPDLYFFDRLEVMSGPSGVFQGSGEPVGTLNLVRKRPTTEFQGQAGLSGDTQGSYRLEADVGGALNDSGSVRARVAAYGEHIDSHVNYSERDAGGVFGTMEVDIGDSATLSFGGIYEKSDTLRFSGLPSFTDGSLLSDLNRDTFIGSTDNQANIETGEFFVEFEKRFDYGGVLKATGRIFDQTADLRNLLGQSPVDPQTRDFDVFWFARDFEQTASYADVNLTSPLALAGRPIELVVGADFRRVEQSFKQNFDFSPGQANIDLFDPTAYPLPVIEFPGVGPGFRLNTESTVDEYGIYAQARVEITDRFKANLGGRYSYYDATSEDTGREIKTENDENNFAPYLGLTYDFSQTVTGYVSYAEIFQPQTETDVTGAVLKPRKGRQVEIGAKYESAGGLLTAQGAYYFIRDENRAQEDPNNLGSFIASSEADTQGVELLLSGKVLPQLEIIGGYAYVDTELETDPTPPQNVSIYGKYSFAAGRFDGLSLGLGLRGSSASKVVSDGVSIEAPSYAVLDAFAAYDISERARVQLNITNLTDNNYITRINTPSRGTYFGQPFTARLALTANF